MHLLRPYHYCSSLDVYSWHDRIAVVAAAAAAEAPAAVARPRRRLLSTVVCSYLSYLPTYLSAYLLTEEP